LALALAALYAVYRKGQRRAFWAALAAFGWGYLLLAFGPWCETSVRPRLLTTNLLDALLPVLHPAPDMTVRLWDATTGRPVNSVAFSPHGKVLSWRAMTAGTPAAARERFQDVGHSLTALLVGVLGGLAGRRFYAHREAAEKAAGVVVKVLEAGL
jgi:hypothetical protein